MRLFKQKFVQYLLLSLWFVVRCDGALYLTMAFNFDILTILLCLSTIGESIVAFISFHILIYSEILHIFFAITCFARAVRCRLYCLRGHVHETHPLAFLKQSLENINSNAQCMKLLSMYVSDFQRHNQQNEEIFANKKLTVFSRKKSCFRQVITQIHILNSPYIPNNMVLSLKNGVNYV